MPDSTDLAPKKWRRSYTQVSTFAECGEKFRLKYHTEASETPTVWLPGGSTFHELTEDIDVALSDERETGEVFSFGLGTAHDWWHEAFSRAVETQEAETGIAPTEWRAASKGKEDVEWWHEHGPVMLHDYYLWSRDSGYEVWKTPDGELAVELEVSFTAGDTVTRGFIDRIWQHQQTGVLLLGDLKSGKNMPHGFMQLAIYREGVRETLGVEIRYGAFYNARKGKLDSRPVLLDFLSPQAVLYVCNAFDRAEEQRIYLPNIGRECGWCNFRDNCRYVGGKEPM